MKNMIEKNIIVSKEFLMGHCIRCIIMQTVHENILIQHSIVPNQNLQCHFLPTVSSAVSNWVTSRGYDRREAAENDLLESFQTRFMLVLLIKKSSRTIAMKLKVLCIEFRSKMAWYSQQVWLIGRFLRRVRSTKQKSLHASQYLLSRECQCHPPWLRGGPLGLWFS